MLVSTIRGDPGIQWVSTGVVVKDFFRLSKEVRHASVKTHGVSFRVRRVGQRNCKVRVIENKMSIEICESKEGLHIFDFSWFWPILDDFGLVFGYSEAIGRENVSEVFDGVYVEEAFVSARVQVILLEPLEYISNMLSVLVQIV